MSNGDGMLKRLFQRVAHATAARAQRSTGGPPAVPRGVRVYAVGDVHGRLDLLLAMEQLIEADRRDTAAARTRSIVHLGDLVDRGFDSRKVLDHLLADRGDGPTRVMLLGNHDLWLREFAAAEATDPEQTASWMRFGGDATLLSYGVKLDLRQPEPERFDAARRAAAGPLPGRRMPRFLDRLEPRLRLRRLLLLPRRHPARRPAGAAERGRSALDPRAVPELERRLRQDRRPRPHGRGGAGDPAQPDRDRHRRLLDRTAHLPRPRAAPSAASCRPAASWQTATGAALGWADPQRRQARSQADDRPGAGRAWTCWSPAAAAISAASSSAICSTPGTGRWSTTTSTPAIAGRRRRPSWSWATSPTGRWLEALLAARRFAAVIHCAAHIWVGEVGARAGALLRQQHRQRDPPVRPVRPGTASGSRCSPRPPRSTASPSWR